MKAFFWMHQKHLVYHPHGMRPHGFGLGHGSLIVFSFLSYIPWMSALQKTHVWISRCFGGNRYGSLTYDGGIAYDLLPSGSRWLVKGRLSYLYPDLHHQNVALRTAYLDRAIDCLLQQTKEQTCIVILGAGFDSRSLRYLGKEQKNLTKWNEIDLPVVSCQKRKLLERFKSRRPFSNLPNLFAADLNDIEAVKCLLPSIRDYYARKENVVSIDFVIEAVLMYLEKTNVVPLLTSCWVEAKKVSPLVTFCFADRLPVQIDEACPYVEEKQARDLFLSLGVEIVDWQCKPGRARHMGVGKVIFWAKIKIYLFYAWVQKIFKYCLPRPYYCNFSVETVCPL